MELPSCPACGQSVIDDDATECPFCGASMSGKPGAGKPGAAAKTQNKATKPAAKAASERKTGAESTAGRKGTTAQKGEKSPAPDAAARKRSRPSESEDKPADDDPFAVDTTAHKNVLQALPKPAKGRLHRVVCPMCETQGFIPKKAAGREVRCANDECLVPIFKTQPIEDPQAGAVEDEPEETGSSPLKMYLAIGTAVVLLAGGGWFWFKYSNPTEVSIEMPPIAESPGTDPTGTDEDKGDSSEKGKQPTPAADVPRVDWTGMRQTILQQSVEAARQSKNNRSKPFCRQMTAEAFALAGEFANAENEIEQLAFVGRQVKYLQIAPLSVLAWEQKARGDEAAAKDAIQRAVALTDQLPTWGRTPIDLSTTLATALASTGQLKAAESLMRQHKADRRDSNLQFSAYLQLQQADEYSQEPLQFTDRYGDWYAPQQVAVTLTLCAHGDFSSALNWVKRSEDVTARAESAAAWARRVVVASGKPDEQIEPLLENLTPAGAARVAAAVGETLAARGDVEDAAGWIDRAESLLAGVAVPEPMPMPSIAATVSFKMPDPAPMWLASVASADLAAAQMQTQKPDAAWESVGRSLGYARAGAPNVTMVRKRQADVAGSPNAVGNTLKRDLRLANNDRVRRALRDYRRELDDIAEVSEAGFDLQLGILRQACQWGLADRVWEEIQTQDLNAAAAERLPYRQTVLPAVVARHLRKAGDADTAAAVEQAASEVKAQVEPLAGLLLAVKSDLDAGKFADAARRIERDRDVEDMVLKNQLVLQVIDTQLLKSDWNTQLAFAQALQNPLWREQALGRVAFLSTRSGAGEQVFEFLEGSEYAPTEVVAMGRGFIAGLRLRPDREPADAAVESSPEAASATKTGG